ncbi:type VI secretion system tip protein TssI/VgrG, partial [Pseudomonas sp. HY2-MNA-CIBAN-0224]|uniref:type VI secretion system tip protein TssI/VgrG n=1 Tax=Pseudomonas sp. HY2-MNA-CIBAN-0224 TaxID=3140471 RepID=UPI003320FBE5
PVRYVHGLVSLFRQGDTGFRRTRYHAVIEPTLARAGLRSNWRMFQYKTVPEIIALVLKGQRITDLEKQICFDHQTREYCVQAGETDLDFIARLAAEEGLLYTFEHRTDGHTLILTDRVGGLGTIGTHKDCPVLYQPMGGGDSAEPALHRFSYTEQVRTSRQVQRDYTFTHPRYNQQHTADGGLALKNQHKDYERYDYPGRYKRDAAGKPFTKTRLHALRSDARMAELEGDDARLQPGLAFDLSEHPRPDFNDRWRSIALEHTGKQHSSLQEEAGGSDYSTTYHLKASAIRWDAEWKAPLQPKPCIDGPHTATVVGPPGEEIYCDEWGRVKVSFPWDRDSQENDHSSCWIRVTQGWAGTLWGAMAVPRIGQELIISYLDGDPDQPIATGRAYRQANLPPYELPKHKTRMTIKSRTHKGTGFNELRFEDEVGQQEVYIHAERDKNVYIKHDNTTFVGNDR